MSEINPQLGTQPGGQQGQQVQVNLRDEKAINVYSNISRVLMGPHVEEVILELGTINHDPSKTEGLLMDISARVYMSVQGAKKLALTLSQVVQRYEQQFGPVELDVRKRFKQPG